MPTNRNRIIYNVQDLFFGSADKEVNSIEGHQILKRINRLQQFDYSINTTRSPASVLGRKNLVSNKVLEPPSVSLNFTYLLEGVNNEMRMGLDVINEASAFSHAYPENPNLVSGLLDPSRSGDRRNVYLTVNNQDNDTHGQHANYPQYEMTGLNHIPVVGDPEATGYGVYIFQNGYMDSYAVSARVGEMPTATVSMTADNLVYYSSGSGVEVPKLNSKDGQVTTDGDKFIIPRHFKENDENLSQGLAHFRPGDITVTVTKNGDPGILYHNETIQGFSAELSIPREPVSYLGYKLYADRAITPPINANISLSMLAQEALTGNFFNDIKNDEDYDLEVNFKTKEGTDGLKYIMSGAKFLEVSYESQIGDSAKTSSMNFTLPLDLDNYKKGFYVSGINISVVGELYETVGGVDKDIYETIDGTDYDIGQAIIPPF